MDIKKMAARYGPTLVAIAIPAVAFIFEMTRRTDAWFTTRLGFAGTAVSFEQVMREGGQDGPAALGWGLGFAVSFGACGSLLIWWAARNQLLLTHRFGRFRRQLMYVPVVAGSADAFVNGACLAMLPGADGRPSRLLPIIAALSWIKFVSYAAALPVVLYVLLDVLVPTPVRYRLRQVLSLPDEVIGRHHSSAKQRQKQLATDETGSTPEEATPAPRATTPRPRPGPGGIAICLSGGGIRAASVAMGALGSLDLPIENTPEQPSLFRQARWLGAVSGGAYAAAGWRISRASEAAIEAPTDISDNLFRRDDPKNGQAESAYVSHVRDHRTYFFNGYGAFTGGLLTVVIRSLATLAAIGAAALLLGWAVGWLVRSPALYPDFASTRPALTEMFVPRVVMAACLPILLAAAAAVAAGLVRDERVRGGVSRIAVGLIVLGLAIGVVTVAVPVALLPIKDLTKALSHHDYGFAGLAVTAGGALLAAIQRVLVSQVKRRWSRLGGVLLGIAFGLAALRMAAAVAIGHAPTWLPISAAGYLLLFAYYPTHRIGLGGVYRRRVADTFAVRRTRSDGLVSAVPYRDEKKWSDYTDDATPHLLVFATQASSTRQVGGLRAAGFCFDEWGVTSYRNPNAPKHRTWDVYPSGSWWQGFPRVWVVSRCMALSGAAFSSAMGRQALGTTNALMAAMNLRLGVWVPNPEVVWDASNPPRVGLAYFFREIFGLYDLEHDPFVYVSDGGHRDNLGLVDMLHREPDEIFVVDASGDEPGTFSTLREAIELARVELGAKVDIDIDQLTARHGELPSDCVLSGNIEHRGKNIKLHYGRYQPCQRCSQSLLQFSAQHPPFPYYSTSDQFLTVDEFNHLLDMGAHVGQRLRELARPPSETASVPAGSVI